MLWKAFLLVGLIVMGIRDCSFRFVEINKNNEDFSISVEYVVFHFNENQDDNFAYKFLRVRRSQSQVSSLLPVWCLHSYPAGLGAVWVCSKSKPRLSFGKCY